MADKKIKMVEIGLMDRKSGGITTVMSEKEDPIYFAIGTDMGGNILLYAFDSYAEIMCLDGDASDKTIDRKFLKKYKMLKANTAKRFREEGKITEASRDLFWDSISEGVYA